MIEWSAIFETGIPVVDEEHKQLFRMLNHMAAEVGKGEQNEDSLNESLDSLMAYSEQHFMDEEKIMMQHKIDNRHFLLQRMEHQSFIYDVTRMRSEVLLDDSITDRFEKLVKFVASWLIYHTLRTDQLMARQVEAIVHGQSPEQAYETALHSALDPAVGNKVLDAVLHLWTEAVERNQLLEQKLKRQILQGGTAEN